MGICARKSIPTSDMAHVAEHHCSVVYSQDAASGSRRRPGRSQRSGLWHTCRETALTEPRSRNVKEGIAFEHLTAHDVARPAIEVDARHDEPAHWPNSLERSLDYESHHYRSQPHENIHESRGCCYPRWLQASRASWTSCSLDLEGDSGPNEAA